MTIPRVPSNAGAFARRPFLLPLVFVLASLPGPGALALDAVPLCDAVRKGQVKVEAIAMHGFEKIDLVIANLTPAPLLVDPAGTVLTPPDRALQRLGLGAPVDAVPGNEASFFASIPASGRWSGCVWAVCLDFGKGVPPSGVPYEVSPELASGEALEVLRYWAKNPGIDQKTVNDIVWSGQGLSVLKSQVIPLKIRKSTLSVGDGQVFWLSGEGALFRLRGQDWEAVGEGFDAVRAGFGMAACTHRASSGVRVFATSQGAWRFLLLPGIPSEVLPAPAFSVIARVDASLYRFGPGSAEFVSACPFSVSMTALKASTHDPELFVVESETGRIKALDKTGSWQELPGGPAARIAATATSLYAVLPGGLFRYQRRWTKIADPAEDLLAGRAALFYRQGPRFTRFDESTCKSTQVPDLSVPPVALAADLTGEALWAVDERGSIWKCEAEAWSFLASVPLK